MKHIEKIINISTNEESIIEREETENERLNREAIETATATKAAEAQAKAEAKAALLAQLGITEEQAKLLLS